MPPELAVAAFSVSALSSLVTVVPRAFGQTDKRALGQLLLATMAGFPLGVWVLRVGDEVTIRWAVSIVVLVTLAALVAGWRMRAAPGVAARLGVGAATGVVGGATGLTGPVVILFNLGAGAPAAVTRANTLVFLTLSLCSCCRICGCRACCAPRRCGWAFCWWCPMLWATGSGRRCSIRRRGDLPARGLCDHRGLGLGRAAGLDVKRGIRACA